MVKSWELNHEFALEDMARTVFLNPAADSRAWYSEFPFLASPNMLHIPPSVGLDNGRVETWTYLSFVWYHTQLILNNSEYQENGNSPIDWGYVYAFINNLSHNDSPSQAGLLDLWMAKGIQISNNGIGPDQVGAGWNWLDADISRQVSPTFRGLWAGTSASIRTQISNALVQGWLVEVQLFTPQQFWTGGQDATRVPSPYQPDSGKLEDRVWYMIPRFRFLGVDQTLITQLAAWAQSIWPLGSWAVDATAGCHLDSADALLIRCTTDQ
jgi:hypothetical protein